MTTQLSLTAAGAVWYKKQQQKARQKGVSPPFFTSSCCPKGRARRMRCRRRSQRWHPAAPCSCGQPPGPSFAAKENGARSHKEIKKTGEQPRKRGVRGGQKWPTAAILGCWVSRSAFSGGAVAHPRPGRATLTYRSAAHNFAKNAAAHIVRVSFDWKSETCGTEIMKLKHEIGFYSDSDPARQHVERCGSQDSKPGRRARSPDPPDPPMHVPGARISCWGSPRSGLVRARVPQIGGRPLVLLGGACARAA